MDTRSDLPQISIEAPLSVKHVRALAPAGPIDHLSLSAPDFCHVKIAREISRWPSVREISLFCTASKAALRQLLETPRLEEIYINDLHQHSSLKGMLLSASLRSLECSFGLSSDDLLEISKLPNLTTLSAQNAQFSGAALESIANMPELTTLNLEGTSLTDEMAAMLASSSKLTRLEIDATRVSAKGLRHICQMQQLQALDIWALNIQEDDLSSLSALPNLSYLSLGGYDGQTTLTAAGVLPRLAALPSLKRLWLDGIPTTKQQEAELKARYEHVKITFEP